MQQSPLFFLEVPFEERLNYITEAYGKYKNEELINSVIRIRKRLGGLDTKNAVNYMLEGNCKEAFRILLKYYDKYYERGRSSLSRSISVIVCKQVDSKINTKELVKILSNGITNTGN
jgi:tRNA 2-selenouridine synthase